MLLFIEVEQAFPAFAVMQSLRHHHFAVQQSVAADLTHQLPEMPVCAVQHRSDAETPGRFPIAVGEGIHSPMLPGTRSQVV